MIGITWIYSSDWLLAAMDLEINAARRIEVSKGILFVLLTSFWAILMVAMAVRRLNRDIRIAQAESSERRLTRIILESPHPTMVLAEDGEILFLSKSWCSQSGYRRSELRTIHNWLRRVCSTDEAQSRWKAISSLFGSEGSVCEGESQIRDNSGNELTWMFSSTPLGPGPDGRLQLLTTAVDTTELRRTRNMLHESVQLYRQMFKDNPVSLLAFDPEQLTILAANSAACSQYGYDQSELLGQPLSTLFQVELSEDLNQLLHHPREKESEGQPILLTQRQKQGAEFKAELRFHPMHFEHHNAWMMMAIDVTQQENAREQTADYVKRLEHATKATFHAVSTLVEMRDPYTAGHERRVGEIAAAIAAELGMERDLQDGLRLCGAVHDVGKVVVPAEILAKPARLNEPEFALVKLHAESGYAILREIDLPWPVAEVARQHHERINGSGYPRGLKGKEIVLEARVIAVADVMESMASHRPYRAALGSSIALKELEKGSGSLFDADVVNACLRLFRQKNYQLPM